GFPAAVPHEFPKLIYGCTENPYWSWLYPVFDPDETVGSPFASGSTPIYTSIDFRERVRRLRCDAKWVLVYPWVDRVVRFVFSAPRFRKAIPGHEVCFG